ncbi:MutS-related protein [Pedobacter alluvionis]|uniref:DNA mismatch repair protein MutS n=1 Tax=Pedobacter alluvionis TaxID=475253 RepID=A0A497Y280_9SPHI|nr:DNA mismatch repair protein MutS [Pedobacter alluvionis]RLJ76981.1 MutS-like protein [Pedobacter alluvionis]TFB33767.1 DNA mismatch repair protein MutS [Pedobacter alluvionis]
MLKQQEEIIAGYQDKIKEVTTDIDQTKKLIDQLSFLRIGLFLAEILFFVLLLRSADDSLRTLIQICLLLPVIAFVFIVRRQSQLDRDIDYKKQLLWVYQNEWNILNGAANGYDHGQAFESELHPYTSDLDIFGAASLFALINRCSTKSGNNILAKNFAEKSTRDTILRRQEAIKEIKDKITETYSFRANLHGYDPDKIEQIKIQLKHQLGAQLEFVKGSFLRFYVKLVPYISVGLILAAILISSVFWKVLALLFIIHTGWNVLLGSKINKVFYTFGGSSNLLNGYASAILWTENQSWKSSYILSLLDSKIPVSKEIKGLSKIIQNFDARLNILVGGILNALLLWDLKCCISLDRWYKSSSKDVISALDHLGDFEELISLATTAYNQTDWVFPVLADQFALTTTHIGHPLINGQVRVNNDFHLEAKPTVDIVTGSNMAGKSTFLRTLGINMVLAYAGAPVCAKTMQLSVFSINTYMRIKDSLNESTSTFKAELNRLKMILDNVVKDKDTFVLIDEMLRGTNSRDKYLGSKVFIQKLITEKTPALFATHDLQLADLIVDYPETVRNFHFDIQITEGEMRFDYLLKYGPCKTFNAAILLKEIGLTLD